MTYVARLLRAHVLQYPGRAASGLLVLTVASTLMMMLSSASAALQFRLNNHLRQIYPEERLHLEASRLGVGMIALESRSITESTLTRIREQEATKQVLPIEPLRVPAMASGRFFGETITSDVVIHGVPRPLVEDALDRDQRWSAPDAEGGVYPVVASMHFVDLYNIGLARAASMPLLNPQKIIGRRFTIVLGRSVVGLGSREQASQTIECELVGLTRKSGSLAMMMPQSVIRALNRNRAPNQPAIYVRLVVDLKPGADQESFLKTAQQLGLQLSSGDLVSKRLKTGVNIAAWGLLGLAASVLVLGLMVFYVMFAMTFHSRRDDLVRLKALGMSPAGTFVLATGEVGVLVFPAVGFALVATLGTARALHQAFEETLVENSALLPNTLFQPSVGWLLLTAACIVMLTLAPALPMLRATLKREPGEAIRDL